MTANAFLAVDFSDYERHDLAAALQEANPGAPLPGKRPSPENWHITLRFLGAIDDPTLDVVAREVERTLDVERGRVSCSGLGAFPRPARAGVVFATVNDHEGRLGAIAAQCEWAAQDAGLEPDERPFVPHVTLSRIRPYRDVRRLFATFGEFAVPIRVDAVALMRADRLRGEVRYDTLERFPLAGGR